nr:MAG TPA: PrcB C-terminal [Caudoviricetes sp.]
MEAVQIVLVICMCENIRDGYSITIKPVKGGDNNDPNTCIK